MLTKREKQHIIETFTMIEPFAAKAAELFYNRLFEIAPQVKPMFKNTDMSKQGRHLMMTIGILVHSIDQLDTFAAHLHKLGKNHIKYGAQAEHYTVVGEALLWALEQGVGDAWNDDVASAWTKLYTYVATTAKEAYEPEIG